MKDRFHRLSHSYFLMHEPPSLRPCFSCQQWGVWHMTQYHGMWLYCSSVAMSHLFLADPQLRSVTISTHELCSNLRLFLLILNSILMRVIGFLKMEDKDIKCHWADNPVPLECIQRFLMAFIGQILRVLQPLQHLTDLLWNSELLKRLQSDDQPPSLPSN